MPKDEGKKVPAAASAAAAGSKKLRKVWIINLSDEAEAQVRAGNGQPSVSVIATFDQVAEAKEWLKNPKANTGRRVAIVSLEERLALTPMMKVEPLK